MGRGFRASGLAADPLARLGSAACGRAAATSPGLTKAERLFQSVRGRRAHTSPDYQGFSEVERTEIEPVTSGVRVLEMHSRPSRRRRRGRRPARSLTPAPQSLAAPNCEGGRRPAGPTFAWSERRTSDTRASAPPPPQPSLLPLGHDAGDRFRKTKQRMPRVPCPSPRPPQRPQACRRTLSERDLLPHTLVIERLKYFRLPFGNFSVPLLQSLRLAGLDERCREHVWNRLLLSSFPSRPPDVWASNGRRPPEIRARPAGRRCRLTGGFPKWSVPGSNR